MWKKLLFPVHCISCRRESPFWLCGQCRPSWRRQGPQRCLRCGLPAPTPLPNCDRCSDFTPIWKRGETALFYTVSVQRALWHFKIRQCTYTGRLLAQLLERRLCQFRSFRKVAAITFVPQPLTRRMRRFFNPAAFLAEFLADRWKKPLLCLLSAGFHRKKQTFQTYGERLQSREDAFFPTQTVPSSLRKGRLLLVDDVCTTGATLDACGRALEEAGFREIYTAVVARALCTKFTEAATVGQK